MVDGVGTPQLPAAWLQRRCSRCAGADLSPLGRWGLLLPTGWRRLHRKLCVVDGSLAFCGGINILDDWVDPTLGALESPLVLTLPCKCAARWLPTCRPAIQLWNRQRWRSTRWNTWIFASCSATGNRGCRRLRAVQQTAATEHSGGAGAGRPGVARQRAQPQPHRKAYRKAIAEAPRGAHCQCLLSARWQVAPRLDPCCAPWVKVRLLLQGRYEYFTQYHGARPVYGVLLAAGIEIFEYRTGFLHAKVAVVDGRWATVGSSNLDPLSLLLAREANVVVVDSAFAQDLRHAPGSAMQRARHRLDARSSTRRGPGASALDRIAFGLMRLGLFLTGTELLSSPSAMLLIYLALGGYPENPVGV